MTPPAPVADADLFPKTCATLERGIARGWQSGAQVAVANPLTGLERTFAIGTDLHGNAVTTESIFPWTCATKPIAALLVGELVAAGRLRFDQPVADIIPAFARHGKGTVTISDLLTHTVVWAGGSDPGSCAEQHDWATTIDAICASALEPTAPPGTAAAYSVWSNWFVLAEVVRLLHRAEFHDLAQARVLTPLRMHDSWVAMSAADIERTQGRRVPLSFRSPGHVPVALDEDLGRCWPGFSGRGTMRDYVRLLAGVLLSRRGDPGAVFDAPVTRELTRPHRSGMRDLTDGSDLIWGYGFAVDARPMGNLCSPDAFGHGSAGGTVFNFADPASGLVVAVACDGIPSGPTVVSRRVSLTKALFLDLRANAGLAGEPRGERNDPSVRSAVDAMTIE